MERTLHFRENWLTLSWGIWGEAELILRIWGAKEKYFQGAEVFFFQGFGEINALFSGIKGAQTPPPPCQGHWRNCSNFCIKYINVCQESIKLFLFLLRDMISH